MTPKEKALSIYNKYWFRLPSKMEDKIKRATSKMFAITTVEEVLGSMDMCDSSRDYWYDVEYQINQL
jgi:hypothetical protein